MATAFLSRMSRYHIGVKADEHGALVASGNQKRAKATALNRHRTVCLRHLNPGPAITRVLARRMPSASPC